MASGRAARKPRNACWTGAPDRRRRPGDDTHRVGVQRRRHLGRPADVLAADRHRLGRAQPEQVVSGAADQRPAAQTVVDELAVAAPSRARPPPATPPSLPFTRSAGGSDLVGDRDLGHLEDVAVARRSRPRGSVQRGQAGDTDRGVGDAGPPRPAHRVADDDRRPRRRAARAARRAGVRPTASGSTGSSAISLRATLDASTPAAARTRPCRVSTMRSVAAARPPRAPSRPRSRPAAPPRASGSAVSSTTSRPSAFDTTLDVTTSTSPSRHVGRVRGDHRGQVVARTHLADADDGQDLDARRARGRPASSTPAPTRRAPSPAVASSSVMSSGTGRTSTPGTSAVSAVVDEPTVEQAAVARAP